MSTKSRSIAAARAVLHVHADEDVCKELARIGGDMRIAVTNAIRASKVAGIEVAGIDPMWFFRFDSPKLETQFHTMAVANGVLFKRGPYNFASLAHEGSVVGEIEKCTSNALIAMRDGEYA